MTFRMPFQEPQPVITMPSRTLLFIGFTAYDLIETGNYWFSQFIEGYIPSRRWDQIRDVLESLRFDNIDNENLPALPCPWCQNTAEHWMSCHDWMEEHGVHANEEEDADGIRIIQRASPVVIDLDPAEDESEDQEMVAIQIIDNNEEIFDIVFDMAVDEATRDNEENGPAPAA
jgi:hypothetical protein